MEEEIIYFYNVKDGKYYQSRYTHEYLNNLIKENQELKERLLVTQTNEETFRLEMKDITQTLGLDEDTIFDDVKAFVRSLEIENQKYKEVIGGKDE